MNLTTESTESIPDYERYDYATVWKKRGIEDRAEKELVSRWAVGETGIELGGGFGRVTQALEKRIGKMFMMDYSLRNLRRASSRLESTTLVRCSLDKLPFDDSVFDFVALIRVMQHIPDPDLLLSEVVRVARNGSTFVLAIGNEDRGWRRGDVVRVKVTETGHRILSTPLSRFGHAGLERLEILGLGAFDNLIGRQAERLFPLSTLDLKTSRLWPVKPMLFIRYRVRKPDGKNEPRVRCWCGGEMLGGRCDACGRSYGRIIDLVT